MDTSSTEVEDPLKQLNLDLTAVKRKIEKLLEKNKKKVAHGSSLYLNEVERYEELLKRKSRLIKEIANLKKLEVL